MKMKKYLFSELIEEITELNTELLYGLDDIVGVTIEKGLIPTIANLTKTELNKFYIVKPDTFVFNPRTHGVRLGMGYNDTENTYITSWNNVAFKVKDEARTLLIPEYLWLYFNRTEWDRETNYHAWGSSTIVFSWNTFRNLSIKLPEKEVQDKIVRQYKVIKNRIKLKKQINDNLANQISAIYDDYFVQYKCSTVTSYIDSPLGKIPSNYKVLTIGELGCDISDGNYSSKYPKADEFQTVGIPFIRGVDFIGTNISKRNLLYITPEKHNELLKGHTKENDILITTRGVGIGKIAFVPSDMIDVNINSQLIRINGGNTYPRVFLSQSLISNRGKNEIQANVTGSAQPQLPVGNFKNIKIVIPPESQILDFCRICNPLLNAQLENYQEIDVLQKLLDVLLTKLSSR